MPTTGGMAAMEMERLIAMQMATYGIEADPDAVREIRREVARDYENFRERTSEAVYAFVNAVTTFAVVGKSPELAAEHMAMTIKNVTDLPQNEIKDALMDAVSAAMGEGNANRLKEMATAGAEIDEMANEIKKMKREPQTGMPTPKGRVPKIGDPSI